MGLNAMRSLTRPRYRGFRRTLLSALGMTAIVLGLLAMHSTGVEHSAAPLPAASAQTTHATHTDAPSATATTLTTVFISATAAAVPCDDACLNGVMVCALMVMTCAVLLAFAALFVFARRLAVYRRLLDAGGRVRAFIQSIPLHLHRPDLTVLSISRT